ncbi:hypothetical protein AGLY_017676 [Aphis glycines]|uniref:Uncharacterized protein n=1 Tax=Aphis glycines TaxID=307491 RepID=A0A6G0SUJ7_APHGL|nr:hypothetical protein AGLY_017676 [Aphis glycines]
MLDLLKLKTLQFIPTKILGGAIVSSSKPRDATEYCCINKNIVIYCRSKNLPTFGFVNYIPTYIKRIVVIFGIAPLTNLNTFRLEKGISYKIITFLIISCGKKCFSQINFTFVTLPFTDDTMSVQALRWCCSLSISPSTSMVEIHKAIAYIPLLYQIFDDKNKNGSLKGANNNQKNILSK